MKSDGINMRNIGEMYVEKCIREYIEDNKEGILGVLEKVCKKEDKVDFEKICGEIRDGVCDRIADYFRKKDIGMFIGDVVMRFRKRLRRLLGK